MITCWFLGGNTIKIDGIGGLLRVNTVWWYDVYNLNVVVWAAENPHALLSVTPALVTTTTTNSHRHSYNNYELI